MSTNSKKDSGLPHMISGVSEEALRAIRRERGFFRVFDQYTYLDMGSICAIPTYGYDIMEHYLRYLRDSGGDMGIYEGAWDTVDWGRAAFAEMINAEARNITFGLSTSWLFNTFFNGLPLRRGDNIITTSTAFKSVFYQVENKAADGIELRVARAHENHLVYEEDVLALADEHTKAIVINHADLQTGYLHNLKTYGEFCRRNHIWFAVDACQTAGCMKIDVKDAQVDFLAASGFKWMCSPLGVGAAYISDRLLPELRQAECGWTGQKNRFPDLKEIPALNLSDNANRFECGGLPVLQILNFTAVAEHYNALGHENVERYVLAHMDYFYERVRELRSFRPWADPPAGHRAGIINLAYSGNLKLTEDFFRENGFRVHPFRDGRVRANFNYMNNKEDIDRYVDFLHTLDDRKA